MIYAQYRRPPRPRSTELAANLLVSIRSNSLLVPRARVGQVLSKSKSMPTTYAPMHFAVRQLLRTTDPSGSPKKAIFSALDACCVETVRSVSIRNRDKQGNVVINRTGPWV